MSGHGVTKSIPDYLKLHRDIHSEETGKEGEFPELAELCASFEACTGWPVRWSRSDRAAHRAAGRPTDNQLQPGAAKLALGQPGEIADRAGAREGAQRLLDAVNGMVNRWQVTRDALCEREAELAAESPLPPRADSLSRLVERLESVLRSGVSALGLQSAGLYLLDEHTTELKLRASYGLPHERLLERPRPLRDALADLEALVGHALTLESPDGFLPFTPPEACGAALCLPVSSPTNLLGTLWFFSDAPRRFSAGDCDLGELVAGRIAAELEREMLLRQGREERGADAATARAARWQRERLPRILPPLEGWDLAAWSAPQGAISTEMHDWSILNAGQLALVLACSSHRDVTAALHLATLQGAVRAACAARHHPGQLLTRLNDALWAASPGGDLASAAYAVVDPESGLLEFSLAGNVAVAVLRGGRQQRTLATGAEQLGREPEGRFPVCRRTLAPGDALLLFGEGWNAARDDRGRPLHPAALTKRLRAAHRQGAAAADLAHAARQAWELGESRGLTGTLVVLKRKST